MSSFDGLTAADLVTELREIRATVFDELGNPMVFIGCPNCGRGGWVVDIITHAAVGNSGRDLNAPCSGACRAQLAAVKDAEADDAAS